MRLFPPSLAGLSIGNGHVDSVASKIREKLRFRKWHYRQVCLRSQSVNKEIKFSSCKLERIGVIVGPVKNGQRPYKTVERQGVRWGMRHGINLALSGEFCYLVP